jgi:hypothetical protein
MKTALMVMNPRDIPYCMTALRSLRVPTCWASYWNEYFASVKINEQIEATDFDRYVLISDDCEPSRDSLAAVLKCHDEHPEMCVTGYSNFDRHLPYVNLCWNRLPPPPPQVDSYRFLKRADAEISLDRGPVPTTFVGLSFTCMSRDLWQRFPLEVSEWGGQMDYILSYRLQTAGIPMISAPGGFVLHHKDKFGVYPDASPEKQLLVGEREACVTWTGVKPEMLPGVSLPEGGERDWAVRLYQDGSKVAVPYSPDLTDGWKSFYDEVELLFADGRKDLEAA